MLLKGFFFDLISFRTDIFFTILLSILSLGLGLRYILSDRIKQKTRRLTLLGGCIVCCVLATAAFHSGRLTRDLSREFYRASGLSSNLVEAPDSGDAFALHWQAYVMLPEGVDKLKIRNSHIGVAAFWDDKVLEMPPSSLDMGSAEARKYQGPGWSYNERSQDKKHSFVWSAEERSVVYLGILQEGAYQLRVHCVPYSSETSLPQELTAFVNGVSVGTVSLQAGWEWRTYTFEVPQRILANQAPGVVQVSFRYSHVYTVKAQRTLAVSFDVISLEPVFKQGEDTQQKVFDFVGPDDLQAGLHRLTIKGEGGDAAAHLRLMMRLRGWLGFIQLARENIFPVTLSESRIHRGWLVERVLLTGCIAAKALLFLFGTYLLFSSFRPANRADSQPAFPSAVKIHFILAFLALKMAMYLYHRNISALCQYLEPEDPRISHCRTWL